MFHEKDHNNNIKLSDFSLTNNKNEKLNSGRWKPNEHDKFLEAIIIHGNDWKLVQKNIKSRSSTQARSHAQKFLFKLGKKLQIDPDSTNKLSKDSIDKIINEMIETTCLRHKSFIDREKLVKLIMGFSNLLVSKVTNQLNIPEKLISTNNSYYQESLIKSNYPLSKIFPKKVFNIEKVVKAQRKQTISLSNAETNEPLSHLLFENMNNQFTSFNGLQLPKVNFNLNQFQNPDDLIKYLFQSAPIIKDPSNPNKNFINIISINICSKNEGENISAITPNNFFASSFLNSNNQSSTSGNTFSSETMLKNAVLFLRAFRVRITIVLCLL